LAYEVTSQSNLPCPDLDALCVGFTCTELSHLHKDGQKTLSIVDGKTSTTLHGILRIVYRKLQKLVVLENVKALLGEARSGDAGKIRANLSTLVEMLEATGYTVEVLLLTGCGLPQNRPRVYIFAGRTVGSGPMDTFVRPPNEFASGMTDAVHPVHLESVQFAEDSTEYQNAMHGSVPDPFSKGDWPSLHRKIYEKADLNWPLSRQEYIEYFGPLLSAGKTIDDLPWCHRAKHILYLIVRTHAADLRFNRLFVDVSQAIGRARPMRGCLPCVTPKGDFVELPVLKRVSGEELLRVQGLFFARCPHIRNCRSGLLQSIAGNAFGAGSAHVAIASLILACNWSLAD
jgi:hypothetical protein